MERDFSRQSGQVGLEKKKVVTLNEIGWNLLNTYLLEHHKGREGKRYVVTKYQIFSNPLKCLQYVPQWSMINDQWTFLVSNNHTISYLHFFIIGCKNNVPLLCYHWHVRSLEHQAWVFLLNGQLNMNSTRIALLQLYGLHCPIHDCLNIVVTLTWIKEHVAFFIHTHTHLGRGLWMKLSVR